MVKVIKTTASISMTPEAWAILHHRSQQAGLTKSGYVESLLRKSDTVVYDLVRQFIIDHYKGTKADLQKLKYQLEQLENDNQNLKTLLTQIGISPSHLPE
jgi:hypothetical protein